MIAVDAKDKVAYTVAEAAQATGVSMSTILRAIHTTGVDKDGRPTFPPPLRAKRKGLGAKAELSINADALKAWHDAWPDA